MFYQNWEKREKVAGEAYNLLARANLQLEPQKPLIKKRELRAGYVQVCFGQEQVATCKALFR
ncbi:hypothetical protein GCM10011323_10750 [Pontibacter amylolyticus]|uniref:Uncharacterized protein n=1 Tax=Pontibacter amylolyticus TaxID=1424080 RepID=A0ABQ1W227_9BACT|nr:hypothetical protein GCM10011323_10750 [Pontibacter amylolyticus]